MTCTHDLIKIPFQNPNSKRALGLYCPTCEPSVHKHYERIKARRLEKMRLGRANARALNLLNQITEIELN